jgi:hypothetical protein
MACITDANSVYLWSDDVETGRTSNSETKLIYLQDRLNVRPRRIERQDYDSKMVSDIRYYH